jgi:uncharacterized membrane protein YoaK (UPF0700 family)
MRGMKPGSPHSRGRGRSDARKIRHFGAVCLAFFTGAVVGGASTLYWGDQTAWVVASLVAACVILMTATRSFPKTSGTMRGVTTGTLKASQEETL